MHEHKILLHCLLQCEVNKAHRDLWDSQHTHTHINITSLSALLVFTKVLFLLLFYMLPLILSSFQHWVIHHTFSGIINFLPSISKHSKFHGASCFLSTSHHFHALWETAEASEVLTSKVFPTCKMLFKKTINNKIFWIYSFNVISISSHKKHYAFYPFTIHFCNVYHQQSIYKLTFMSLKSVWGSGLLWQQSQPSN